MSLCNKPNLKRHLEIEKKNDKKAAVKNKLSKLYFLFTCLGCGLVPSRLKIYFPLFKTHHYTLPYPKTRQWKTKFEPMIKLNLNNGETASGETFALIATSQLQKH